MKQFWLQFFTWWNGETLGTRFYTWRFGKPVGQDELGNRYYRAEGPLIDRSVGTERRWVIYNGVADASKVPPGWRAWLAHNASLPPSEETYIPREWEKPHLPNMTGTPQAYHPPGSQLGTGQRSRRDRRLRPLEPDRVGAFLRASQPARSGGRTIAGEQPRLRTIRMPGSPAPGRVRYPALRRCPSAPPRARRQPGGDTIAASPRLQFWHRIGPEDLGAVADAIGEGERAAAKQPDIPSDDEFRRRPT